LDMDNSMLVLSCLRKNAREKLKEVSRKTKIPVSTIFEAVKKNSRLVQKYTTLVDFNKFGFSVKANMILRVHKDNRELLRSFLEKHQNVNSVYRINNGYDFMIEAVFRNIAGFEEFREQINDRFRIKDLKVFHVVEDIKRESFMSEPDLLGII
jgi:DNA-binding Lrp family transcriptional regulator